MTPPRPTPSESAAAPTGAGGPGTELKKLFASLGIRPNSNCKCNALAHEIDQHGIAWCEATVETIVDWLEEAAKALGGWQGILFTRVAARAAVWLAIRKAKR